MVEIKKVSGLSKSLDSDIRMHSKENADFLTQQIQFLKPDVIVCCGPIVWKSLTKDLNIFEDNSFPIDTKGIFKKDGIVVCNTYHPSLVASMITIVFLT